MPKFKENDSFSFLDEFRGRIFEGEWPTLTEMFDITVERYPNNNCFRQFVPEDFTLTYKEAKDTIIGLSNYFLSHGATKGDKVALVGKNSVEWAVSYLAIEYAGCIVVPLDVNMHLEEIESLMKFAEVSYMLTDFSLLNVINQDNKLNIRNTLCLEEKGSDKYILNNLEKGPLSDKAIKANSDDIAAILFTSGTTGTPKGVMLTHDNLVSDSYKAQENMKLYSTDVFYAILPIHHAYTMLAVFIVAISVGSEIVFGKRLVVSQLLKELKDGKVTMFLGVPMLFNKLLAGLLDGVKKKSLILYGLIRFLMGISGLIKKVFKKNVGHKMFGFLLKQISLDTNRICISGGGPLPASTFKMFNELGIDFVQGYGLTETSPITHLNPVEAYIESSVGKLIPTLEQKIVNPDSDGNGIIYLKGSVIMKGYYNNEEATKDVLGEDGWFNTGDVGHIDRNGYLYLTGRAKSIIVTEGGKNVFPEEIEDHFQLYNEISQICIIGYDKNPAMKIEGIKAIILPTETFLEEMENDMKRIKIKMECIVDEVNKELKTYQKIEKLTIATEELPSTSTKKIKRYEVKKLYR
ncbi:MAG: AMP-binding protein [Spirochaetaceae bacterium]|nr:AMP-binding protein [Spirochaetaceae bacterium]